MSTIESEIETIESDSKLKNSLENFIEAVIADRMLIFPKASHAFDPALIERGVLKQDNENYSIANFQLVAHYILNYYKNTYSFETKANFKENVDFLKQVEADFNSNKYVHYFHQVEEDLWRLMIKDANQKFQCNFNDYLESLDKENFSGEIFTFIEAYSSQLSLLTLPVGVIHENAIILLDLAKSDAAYNLPQGSILNGIKSVCSNSYPVGLELFELAVHKQKTNDDILSAIISGLYEVKKKAFYETHLKFRVEAEENLAAIIRGLSTINEIKENECELFIQLFDRFKGNQHLTLQLLSLLISILRTSNTEINEKYANDCFERLKLSLEDDAVVYYVLHNITYINHYENERSDLVVSLIGQKYFDIDKHLKAIDQVFWHLRDYNSFKKVVLAIITHKPFEFFSKHLTSALYKIDKVELDNFLIELFTDNDASKRFGGNDLFNELSTHKPHKFSIDILALAPIMQYKLWVAITQSFREPKSFIPTILPLIDSQSDIVKEAFICKLEQLSEDYGGHIIEVLENKLDKNNQWHRELIERISNYMNRFYNIFIDIKRPIKELNPFYTNNKELQLFNQFHFKKLSGTIQKGAERNSFLSVLGADTVQLSKGGGFRFGNKREISKLGSFTSSFSLPRSYFINSNDFELEHGFETRRDWSNEEFESIQEIINNEQQ